MENNDNNRTPKHGYPTKRIRPNRLSRTGRGDTQKASPDAEALPDGQRQASGRSKYTHARVKQAKKGEKKQGEKKQRGIAAIVNKWFDRVMGAMRSDGLSEAEAEYAPHRTTRDFLWNSLGSAAWALVFPVVTIVSTQLVGVDQAGMISMAFVVGILLMFIGNYGVRTYQVSDIDSEYSFRDYQAMRWITCILMLAVGWIWCFAKGYSSEMFNISMGIILYKLVDALADVYEGRLQQVDKLYLAGISQTLRSVLALVAFCIALFLTRNGVIAAFAMAIVAAATFIVLTWPLTLMEAPPSKGFSMSGLVGLLKVCTPLFVAIFMFNLIENMPKFVMEGMLPYDNQLYYNAIYFPAQMILIIAQLIYKPLLLRMAGVWQDASKRIKFDLIMLGLIAAIALITVVACIIMRWIGVPILSFLYGVDFSSYRGLLLLMLVTGGIVAAVDFLYQVITIMRRQKDVTVLYVIAFGFSLFIPYLLIRYAQLEGAVLSYVIIEAILFVLLVWEYFRIRFEMSRSGKAANLNSDSGSHDASEHEHINFIDLIDPGDAEIDAHATSEVVEEPRKMRPSEKRAERERREEIIRKRTHRE